MDAVTRIEHALAAAVSHADAAGCPPGLAAAMRHAVFPRGARIRPRICLAVASACREDDPVITDAAAAAIELLHCASLVHDDLPCFDDADTRRGKPSVHRLFGERLAVLSGDALIVLAFQTLALAARVPQRLGALLVTVSGSVGVPAGIVAGQAWECEPRAELAHYHRQKTGALFAAATVAGAAAAGAEPEAWRVLGERIGEAYQVADDIRDAVADADEIGKPTGQDLAHGRPSATIELGVEGAVQRLEQLVADAMASIPPCAGAAELRALIRLEARRLLPKKLARRAA
ncbi:MAG: polyprenyl synthetase family protein [Xanthobacteraceae bacterium]